MAVPLSPEDPVIRAADISPEVVADDPVPDVEVALATPEDPEILYPSPAAGVMLSWPLTTSSPGSGKVTSSPSMVVQLSFTLHTNMLGRLSKEVCRFKRPRRYFRAGLLATWTRAQF